MGCCMKVYTPYVSAIIFLVMVAGMGLFFLNIKSNYNVSGDEDFTQTFDQLNDTYDLAVKTGEDLQGEGLTSQEDLFTAGWRSIKGIWSSIGVTKDIIVKSGEALKISPFYTFAFISVIIVILIITIAYAVFGKR